MVNTTDGGVENSATTRLMKVVALLGLVAAYTALGSLLARLFLVVVLGGMESWGTAGFVKAFSIVFGDGSGFFYERIIGGITIWLLSKTIIYVVIGEWSLHRFVRRK
jgi:hypothetical protein